MFLSMANNLSSFLTWLSQTMDEKEIYPVDIARTGFVTDSAVSLLFSMKTKSVSVDMCKAVSKATGVPLIAVYRKAGHLPEDPTEDEWVEEQDHNLRKLSPKSRSVAGRLIASLVEEDESEQKAKPKAKPAKA